MDGDIFGDTLVDDLLALTGAGGDFDTSDMMDILEPDYLENNILLDDVGTLNSIGDTTALDDLSNFSDAPVPTADVHASFDAAVSAHDEAEAAEQVGDQTTTPTPARRTPELNVAQQAPKPEEPQEPEDEDDAPQDPLDQVTSGMLPEEDLEALARLAAGDDEFLAGDSDNMGLDDATDPFTSGAALGASDLSTSDLGATDFGEPDPDEPEPGEPEASEPKRSTPSLGKPEPSAPEPDTANTGATGSGRASFGSDVTSSREKSGKNLLEDTLDERNQPSMDELEELALLASGGADLSSVVMPEEEDDDDDNDAQNTQPSAESTASADRRPSAESTASADRRPSTETPSDLPPRAEAPSNQNTAPSQATPATAPTAPRFSQVARSWSQGTTLSSSSSDASSTPSSTTSSTTPAAHQNTLATPAELARHYRPPNQLRRYFNAGIMLEAADRLKDVLDIPEIPLVVFLGRAAERCLEHLPDHDSVTVAHLAGSSFMPSFQVPRQESFRRVLMAKDRAESDTPEAATEAEAVGSSQQQGVLVADISDLELDDLSVALTGTHLLLTRLQTDPVSQELKGTLTLVGDVDLRSGANFLRDVKEALESPITLMV